MYLNNKLLIIVLLIYCFTITANAKDGKQLTLNSMVDIAINNSYQTKRLEYDIKRSIHWLNAERAGLKTQIYMNLISPDLQKISEHKWNSNLFRDEIVRQNTQHWQSDLAIKHPLILWSCNSGSVSCVLDTIPNALKAELRLLPLPRLSNMERPGAPALSTKPTDAARLCDPAA